MLILANFFPPIIAQGDSLNSYKEKCRCKKSKKKLSESSELSFYIHSVNSARNWLNVIMRQPSISPSSSRSSSPDTSAHLRTAASLSSYISCLTASHSCRISSSDSSAVWKALLMRRRLLERDERLKALHSSNRSATVSCIAKSSTCPYVGIPFIFVVLVLMSAFSSCMQR